MTNLLRWHGLELPVYPPETAVAYNDPAFVDAALLSDSFVRTARVRTVAHKSLKQCLEITDTELATIAECCNAEVIGHAWGLYKPPTDSLLHGLSWCTPNGILPTNYILVAAVDSVKEAKPVSAQLGLFQRLQEKINTHALSRQANGVPTIADMSGAQFLLGSVRSQSSTWLVDIEPRLCFPIKTKHFTNISN